MPGLRNIRPKYCRHKATPSEFLMRRLLVLMALVSLFQVGCSSGNQAPVKPKELESLHQYVGSWTADTTNKPAVWDPNGAKFQAVSQTEMVLDGWFLHHIDVSHIVGETDKVTKSLNLWTFDPNSKKYVAWPFQSTGITGPSTGDWNSTTKTFTYIPAEPPPNTTGKMTDQFVDANTIQGNLTFTDWGSGKTLMDMVWTRNRDPKVAAKATREQWEKIGTPIQPLPAEIMKLQPFIGEWDSEFILGPSVQSPQGSTSKGKMTGKWILDGRFLLGTSEVGTHRSIWLIGYDTTKQAYRYVHFNNAGQIDESFGQWNDQALSFVWHVVNERPGITRTSTNQILGNDTVQAHILAKDNAGKVYQDLTIKSSRRK